MLQKLLRCFYNGNLLIIDKLLQILTFPLRNVLFQVLLVKLLMSGFTTWTMMVLFPTVNSSKCWRWWSETIWRTLSSSRSWTRRSSFTTRWGITSGIRRDWKLTDVPGQWWEDQLWWILPGSEEHWYSYTYGGGGLGQISHFIFIYVECKHLWSFILMPVNVIKSNISRILSKHSLIYTNPEQNFSCFQALLLNIWNPLNLKDKRLRHFTWVEGREREYL